MRAPRDLAVAEGVPASMGHHQYVVLASEVNDETTENAPVVGGYRMAQSARGLPPRVKTRRVPTVARGGALFGEQISGNELNTPSIRPYPCGSSAPTPHRK